MTSTLTAGVQAPGTPESRSTQFSSQPGVAPQTSDAGTFMVVAYVLMWLATVLFITHTWRKARGLQLRIDTLQASLSKSAGADPG